MLIMLTRKPEHSARGVGERSYFYPLLGLATALVGLFWPSFTAQTALQGSHRYVHLSRVAQQEDEDQTDEPEVATSDIDKYVAVYKAMQRDRSLTVEQAASAQGMTLKAFRDLENRIERDESAREHARQELRTTASPEASPTVSDHPSATPSQRALP